MICRPPNSSPAPSRIARDTAGTSQMHSEARRALGNVEQKKPSVMGKVGQADSRPPHRVRCCTQLLGCVRWDCRSLNATQARFSRDTICAKFAMRLTRPCPTHIGHGLKSAQRAANCTCTSFLTRGHVRVAPVRKSATSLICSSIFQKSLFQTASITKEGICSPKMQQGDQGGDCPHVHGLAASGECSRLDLASVFANPKTVFLPVYHGVLDLDFWGTPFTTVFLKGQA